MRAFMSRVHPPSSPMHAEWLGHPDFGRFADQAEREARRILAETEREVWTPSEPDVIRATWTDGRSALAEALAAYVGGAQ